MPLGKVKVIRKRELRFQNLSEFVTFCLVRRCRKRGKHRLWKGTMQNGTMPRAFFTYGDYGKRHRSFLAVRRAVFLDRKSAILAVSEGYHVIQKCQYKRCIAPNCLQLSIRHGTALPRVLLRQYLEV